MSRIPNPFLGGPGQQQTTPKKPSTPGFLLMTRPATGSNSYGGGGRSYGGQHSSSSPPMTRPATGSNSYGGGGRSYDGQHAPLITSPPGAADGFIPFSAISDSSNNRNHDSNRRGGNRGGGDNANGGRYYGGGGGGRHMTNQASPRFPYPYQQSPGRMPNHYGQGQNYSNSPRGNPNYGHQRGGRFGGQNWHGNNNRGNSRGGFNARGPLSDIPIDKFVSTNMIQDPWAEFEEDEAIVSGSSPLVTLDNSEIIIDSDASVVIENSYEEGISGTEGDSSPVHDTGSDSPYHIATSSTSEKDTGSDSTSDA